MGEALASDAGSASPNRYVVEVRRDEGTWSVAIVDPAGVPVTTRVCRDEAEARTYASTVRQHVEWLSEAKFREYYRLDEER